MGGGEGGGEGVKTWDKKGVCGVACEHTPVPSSSVFLLQPTSEKGGDFSPCWREHFSLVPKCLERKKTSNSETDLSLFLISG